MITWKIKKPLLPPAILAIVDIVWGEQVRNKLILLAVILLNLL